MKQKNLRHHLQDIPRKLAKPVIVRGKKYSRAFLVGILATICMYVGVAGMTSVAVPWLTRGDTRQHVDYIWRLSNGDIPKWYDKIQYPAFKEDRVKFQSASANPPLFYMIHAPFVGPLLNSGHWQVAILVGRVINIVIGIGCILALAWGSWLVGGKHRELLAVAVPALVVMFYRFTRLNQDYALDALLLLLSTLSLITCIKIIQRGLNRRYMAALTLLSVLGMATKAPYLVFLVTNILTLMYVATDSAKHISKKHVLRAITLVSVLLFAVVVSIGWFYYFWNYKTNGGWFHSSPPGYTGGRPYQSLTTILLNGKIIQLLYAEYSRNILLSVALSATAVAGYYTLTVSEVRRYFRNHQARAVIALLLLAFIGTVLTQVKFATGYGAINFRYLIPALFPIGLFMAYGLLQFKNLRGIGVSLAAVLLGLSTFTALGGGGFRTLFRMTASNGLPYVFTGLLLISFVLGSIALVLSLYVLTGRKQLAGSKE